MTLVLQTILVFVILAAMVMILIGIPRMFNSDVYDNPDMTSLLRKEVEEVENVVTENSAFVPWLQRQTQRISLRVPWSRR